MEYYGKIVQVLYSGLGGHGTVAFSLLDGFEKAGYNNAFIFYGVENINPSYKNILTEKEKKFYGIKKETKTGLKEWVKFYSLLKKNKPDIILLHSPQLILVSFIYKFFHLKTKIITVEHDAISIRTKAKWIVTNLNAIFANNVVILNNDYKKQIKCNLWFKNLINKYKLIPNGINTHIYTSHKLFTKKETNLLMASRMINLRDHETLITAVNSLINKGFKLKLKIAGNGDTLNKLKSKYENEKIIFLGNLNEKDLLAVYNKTDIYVHATFAETFSTAILQAMTCSLPVITSDIEGTRHMIKDTHNGLLYKNKNINDLMRKIEFCIKNQNKAIQLGLNARKDVLNKYSNELVINKYVDLFF